MKTLEIWKTQSNVLMVIKTPESNPKNILWNNPPLFDAQQSVPIDLVSSLIIPAVKKNISHQSRFSGLKEKDLIKSITELFDDILSTNLFKIKFTATTHIDIESEIPEEKKIALFQIVQEQMNNIIRHSNACNIRVNLMSNKFGVILYIYDDGKGFDLCNINKGQGLSDIYESAKVFNGRVDILTSSGKGCSITVLMPPDQYLNFKQICNNDFKNSI
jgi:signal transduction histidine kinase